MSVLFANDHGWLLDSCSLIDEGFQRCFSVNKGNFTCRFNKQYFDIMKPHLVSKGRDGMISNDLSTTTIAVDQDNRTDPNARKKRKRKQSDLNQGELDAEAYHEKVRLLVLEGSQTLLEGGWHCGYLTEALQCVQTKQVSTHECELAALCDMAKQLPSFQNLDLDLDLDLDLAPMQAIRGQADVDAHLDLFSCLTENPHDYACEVTLMSKRYFLPAHSRFLLSDFTLLQPLISSGDKYDLIVLDPPWENKSVKRSSRYSFLPSSQLKQLPVAALSAAGCLVVTWITNRPRHLRFVREELYPHWGVTLLGEWLWVKVTRKGEFVFPLDSPHKKPYEVLLLGRFCANSSGTARSKESEIPAQRLIVSVPSALHSHKPSLSAVLKPYISPNAKCLEMFARSLHPYWTSWGNEVIKFQHHSYFSTESLGCEDAAFTESTVVDKQLNSGIVEPYALP